MRLIYDAQTDIPVGFTEVEYLQSSGTQYIDTGYKPTVDTETEVFFDNYQFSRIEYFFGCYSTDYRTNCYHAGCYQNDIRVFVNGSPELSSYVGNYVASGGTTGVPFPTILQSIKMTKSSVVVNGITYTYTQNPNTPINVTHNMLLFGASDAGSFRSDRGFNGKIKCCRIKNGNILVRDFIPCLDASNVPCMYDLVEQKAYYNAGTGSFSYGHTITPVEYLESTGTQYIDTGVIPTNTHGISINFSFSSNESFDGSWCPIGARTGDIRFWINKSVEQSGLTFGFGDYTPSRQTQPKNTLLKASLNLYNNRKMIYVNGNYQANITSSISNLSNTIYLFGANVNGSISFIPPDCRIYSTQITEGSAIVRDYIPCIDENNVGFMFDKVTHSLYANAGTGSFITGSEIKKKMLRLLMGDKTRILM